MSAFSRHSALAQLADWNVSNPANAVSALLDRWAVPGMPTTPSTPLRLAMRAGYVSLSAKGQSVARLDWTRTGPRLSVHRAYVER